MSTLENYILDTARMIVAIAREARAERDLARKTGAYEEKAARLMALYEVISLLQEQAKAFGVPLEDIGLDNIDPDNDLL